MGRPAYQPTDQDRKTVEAMVAGGIDQTAIAAVLGIARTTLARHFRAEIDTAAARANARVIRSLYQTATSDKADPKQRVTAQIFWLKCRAGWREPSQDHLHGNLDGKPLALNIITGVPRAADATPAVGQD